VSILTKVEASTLAIGDTFAMLGTYTRDPYLYRIIRETDQRLYVEQVEGGRYSGPASGNKDKYVDKPRKVYPVTGDAHWQQFKSAVAVLNNDLDTAKEAYRDATEAAWSKFHAAAAAHD
jgi:hypothetical protein